MGTYDQWKTRSPDDEPNSANMQEPDDGLFFHASSKPDACDHDFQGWREFELENGAGGGEQVCTKCGMGALAYSLRTGI